jgi:hypothetical protein
MVKMWQMVESHVPDEGAANFVIACAAMQPAEENKKLNASREGDDNPVGIHEVWCCCEIWKRMEMDRHAPQRTCPKLVGNRLDCNRAMEVRLPSRRNQPLKPKERPPGPNPSCMLLDLEFWTCALSSDAGMPSVLPSSEVSVPYRPERPERPESVSDREALPNAI